METYGLIISNIISFVLLFYLVKQKNKTQLMKYFIFTVSLICFWNVISTIQKYICIKYENINPIYFDYLTYVSTCFLPISVLFTAKTFANTKLKDNKCELLLFIIPILSLIILWTSNWHHLFYIKYSLTYNETKYGIYFNYFHTPYSYIILIRAIYIMIKYSIKNAGFFSKQSILFIISAIPPIFINILGTLNIIPMTIYATPISFSFTILILSLAMFKFNFLSSTPIAMQKIVDRMSDSFIVVNDSGIITDFNAAFINTFKLNEKNIRNIELMNLIKSKKLENINESLITETINKSKSTPDVILVKKEERINDKYFNIEATGIYSKNNSNNYLGCLFLLKNVTQHILDKNIIEDKQSQLIEKERLASLGQMIGGIAHNLKTPIMSISGATEGLLDLTKEYDISIGDPDVTNEDHHAIVADMNEWISKIKTHVSYMSDVITAVKGQAVAFSNNNSDSFTIAELLKHVEVLMKHELKHSLIDLNVKSLIPTSISIKGNINSLVQVINNLISNAIQAYNGEPNKIIDFIINMKENYVIFSIRDYGCGMPEKVKEKLFKEMITTKGKNGTGLGLFMSHSNIRAHFDGEMTFESNEGKGTRFDIFIPLR